MLADIVPTAYEVGVLNGAVAPGDTVAVVGAGPIGLAAIMTARLFSPARIIAVDLAQSRLEAAKRFGADAVVDARTIPRSAGRRAHRRARRRRGHRGGRRAGDLRTVHPPGAPRRPRRQRRRARQAGDPAPGRPVDQERHHHHRPGRHPLHADPAEHAGGRVSWTPRRSSPTTSRWTPWWRPTTPSPGRPTPMP